MTIGISQIMKCDKNVRISEGFHHLLIIKKLMYSGETSASKREKTRSCRDDDLTLDVCHVWKDKGRNEKIIETVKVIGKENSRE